MASEEPPESLFMKELRRRGMTPTSLLEDTNKTEYGVNDETSKEARAFSQRNAVSTEVEKNLSNQRERSMMLNSEGLEGLIPRAKLLLTIGGTFFLGFWPLIIITIASFSALYFYFGPAFVHDASETPIPPPQYVDPYALLEEERISTIAPHVN
ncbi:tubulin alpha-6 chain [Trema orientale]|uniref:Tubulin alpha-6 chain n=1 Tax=Trema orientale TaxID=63057 RepID=A0A2P5EMV9_TREOI|nr:tubulin alpha-6 chain [Trema orientale]